MPRPSVRLLSAALCAAVLGGCSAIGLGDATPAQKPGQTADASTAMAPDIESNLRQTQILRANNDLLGATRIISQLMLVYPDDARVVGEYGKLLVQENRSADAVQFLHRAIELNPNDWSFYSALGVAFDQQANHGDAKLAYEKALQLNPGEPAVLNNYAMSCMLTGDNAGARKYLLAAKAAGATDPKIDANLALLDKTAPASAVAAPSGALAAAPPRKAVASVHSMALAPAPGAPTPLALGRVVMQAVPIDPLAGPVKSKPHPARVAKTAGHKPAKVASAPVKKTKPTADHIPSLRMTADAGKP